MAAKALRSEYTGCETEKYKYGMIKMRHRLGNGYSNGNLKKQRLGAI